MPKCGKKTFPKERALLKRIAAMKPIDLYRIGQDWHKEDRVELLEAAARVGFEHCNPDRIGRYEYMNAEVVDGKVRRFLVVASDEEDAMLLKTTIAPTGNQGGYPTIEIRNDWVPYARAADAVRNTAVVPKALPQGETVKFCTAPISDAAWSKQTKLRSVVAGVANNSQADRAGIRNGDLVVTVNGRPIRKDTESVTGGPNTILGIREQTFIQLHAK